MVSVCKETRGHFMYCKSGQKCVLTLDERVQCLHQKVICSCMFVCLFTSISIVVHADGSITAECPNPAVPECVLREVLEWKISGVATDDVIDRLRVRTVPPGYPIHPWIHGWFVCTHHASVV